MATPFIASGAAAATSQRDYRSALIELSQNAKLLMDMLREGGLKSDGQISRRVLRQACARAGLAVPRKSAIEDLFGALDPEATGTIDFVDLFNELRMVKKRTTSPPRSLAVAGLTGGGSVATPRGEDGKPLGEAELAKHAAEMQAAGKLPQAIVALEKVLALQRGRSPSSAESAASASRCADLCNSLGMSMLQQDLFVDSLKQLKRAETFAHEARHRPLIAVTLNNLACYHRRRGQPKVALSYLLRALDTEAKCRAPHRPADTHLNACAVLSQLGSHHQAMRHAKAALYLLKQELSLDKGPLNLMDGMPSPSATTGPDGGAAGGSGGGGGAVGGSGGMRSHVTVTVSMAISPV